MACNLGSILAQQKMSDNIFINRYVLEYVKPDLEW